MSGRRLHSRYGGSAEGTIRVCRDVSILKETPGLSVLSDVHVPAGEELTLSISSGAGELQLRVRVNTTEPHVTNGAVRHRLGLTILNVTHPADPALPED